jgi:hypothetical protein
LLVNDANTTTITNNAQERTLPAPVMTLSTAADATTSCQPYARSLAFRRLTSTVFRRNVANPGSFLLSDEDGYYESSLFSVVPLPCLMRNGAAGYCRPTRAIRNDYDVTNSALICSSGEAAPCAGLAVGSVTFACCIGSGDSLLQSSAVYRNGNVEILENHATTFRDITFIAVLANMIVGILLLH